MAPQTLNALMSSHTRSLTRWTAILGTTLCMLVSAMLFVIWSDRQKIDDASAVNAEILNIRVQRDGFDDIQLSKIEEQWQIDSPCNLPANEQRLAPLMGALAPGTHRYMANEVDLDAAGLTNPEAIVYLNGLEHRIGNADLNGDRRYVQRDDMVEFAPEWVLSLINGGVTALARLEIFAAPLSSLSVKGDNGHTHDFRLPDELAIWQSLTAQKITTWPLLESDLSTNRKVHTIDTNDNKLVYTVYENQSLTVIRLDGAACAYILPADALPK